METSISK